MHALKNAVKKSFQAMGYDIVKRPHGGARLRPDLRFGLNVFDLVVSDFIRSRSLDTVSLLQIGANDGLREDAVRPILLRTGMRAVLVEPIPQVYAQLSQNYAGVPGVVTVNAAIGAGDGSIELFCIAPGLSDDASLIASFDRHHVDKWRRNWGLPDGSIVSVTVPCLSVATILRQQGLGSVSIAAIDTEGMDHIICNQLLDLATPPDIIHFEYSNSPEAEIRKTLHRLHGMGYAVCRSGLDMTARRTSAAQG